MKSDSRSPWDVVDRQHIWHPYAGMSDPLPVCCVASASGVRLRLTDGRELVDGMSSWWAAIHGYNVPELNSAAVQQVNQMAHVMFGGLTHEPAIELTQLLLELTPDALDTVFFCDSGSVAVEVAMKMAQQYWYACGERSRNRFLTIRGGYHGDTYHAMSVCDPVQGMHRLFRNSLPEYLFADRPGCRFGERWDAGDLDSFRKLIERCHRELAAVILEPVVQGAGGLHFYHPEYLRGVRELCDRTGVLLIFDEIATGFGRTGEMFAGAHARVTPDILCLGKALTGGYLSLAATLTTREVSRGISAGEPGVFMHGPTFMANPLACRVAAASIRLLSSTDWQGRVRRIEQQLKAELAGCRALAAVVDVRVLGAIGVVELDRPVNMPVVQQRFVEKGVWIRPFGKLVYLMPPYIIEPGDLSRLTSAIQAVVKQGDCLLQ